jgi:hypothetical protein
MKDQEFDAMMESVRELGHLTYPSPFYGRAYQFPAAYPPATVIKHTIGDPLGVMLFAIDCKQRGVASQMDLETQTASFMTRHRAWRCDFPLYLVTEGLASMLIQTDRLDSPNVDRDSKPPFPAGFFVLPKHLLGMAETGAYVTTLGYAVLGWADAEGTPIRFPDEMREGRRLYVTAEMSDGTGYYAKLEVSDTGEVENPKDSPYSEDPNIGRSGRQLKEEERKPRFMMADGPAVLDICTNFVLALCTYLNLDRAKGTVEVAEMTGKAKAKRGKPGREFWKPAMIGVGLHPTGCATQGSHASPHSHIRRGHWRWQHYGKDNSLVKRKWIEPTLVMGRSEIE